MALRLSRKTADHFCGCGGFSHAVKRVTGRSPDFAVNHDKTAIVVHSANHPETKHMMQNMFKVSPRGTLKRGDLWFFCTSPDCRDFSIAKGGKPRDQKVRCLAWTAVRWARDLQPDMFFLENVREFTGWGPLDAKGKRIKARKGETFKRWVRELQRIGYVVEWRVLNAADFGVPQNRRRLFVVARRDGKPIVWPEPTHGPGLLPYRTAAECIDFTRECPSIFPCECRAPMANRKRATHCGACGGRMKALADNTLWRIAEGLRRFVLENPEPFIIKTNHGGTRPAEMIGNPMSTVTASRDYGALVVPLLVNTRNGERETQAARVFDVREPHRTVTAQGSQGALVSAFISKAYGDRGKPEKTKHLASDLDAPLGTVSTKDHNHLVAASLVKMYGTSHGASAAGPMPTVTATGNHVAEVRAFLTAYYGDDHAPGKGSDLRAPMRTIPTKARYGLVTVRGVDYQIVDIGFRMLDWDELLNAQWTPELAREYDLSGAKTKAKKTKLIGNSVPPLLAEAVIRANTMPSTRARRGQLALGLAA